MKRRIVFGSLGPPDWRDANAWAYRCFAHLRGGPFELTYVQLLSAPDEFYFRYLYGADFANPHRLDSVVTCRLEEGSRAEQPALVSLLRSSSPDLVVAWGCDAARLLHLAAPRTPLVLMLTDSNFVERLVEAELVRDWIGFRAALELGVAFPHRLEAPQREAFEAAELIVSVSAIANAGFEDLMPSLSGKIYERSLTPADLLYAEAEHFRDRSRPFADRDIDVLFCAADWTRRAANLPVVERVAAALAGREIHLVGEIDRTVSGTRAHAALRLGEDLYDLLGRTRVVVSPALVDGGPSLLFAASAMGCNVVASPNCGYSALCNDALLARRCTAEGLLERIRPALFRPYADRRDQFLGGTADLAETLAVV